VFGAWASVAAEAPSPPSPASGGGKVIARQIALFAARRRRARTRITFSAKCGGRRAADQKKKLLLADGKEFHFRCRHSAVSDQKLMLRRRNVNGHERHGARTSGVTHRNRGRPTTEPEGINIAVKIDRRTFAIMQGRFLCQTIRSKRSKYRQSSHFSGTQAGHRETLTIGDPI